MNVLTPKERWLAVMRREKPDRLPMDYWGTPEATQKLMQHLGCASEWDVFERLHIDRMLSVAPVYIGPQIEQGLDMYGCRHQDIYYSGGIYSECVFHPLAQYATIDEIDHAYTWPTADWFDYSVIREQIKGKENFPIQGGGSEPFLIYKNLRGMEQAYIDLLTDPELVTYCLDKMFDFCYENTVRIYEQLPGQVNFSYIAEDLGGQKNLLFSPHVIREIFVPRMKRMIDLAHEAGVYAFFHSDGAIHEVIPDLIEAGIDVLNPLQWRCPGMSREELKREFGDRVVLHGGVDNQYTLPFGSVDEVRAEVIQNIEILGHDGGYILAPCHNIQEISPAENIIALYEAGYACGKM